MNSSFYKNRFERRFPVSLLMLERLTHAELSEQGVTQALLDCGLKQVSEDDLVYIMDRISAETKPAKADGEKIVYKGRSFASSYLETLNKQDVATLLLYACGWDYTKAEWTYCNVDKDDVMDLLGKFMEFRMQENVVAFEACMFGFGGKYEDSPKGLMNLQEMDFDDLDQLNKRLVM